jgi:uncharacterized membrane protein
MKKRVWISAAVIIIAAAFIRSLSLGLHSLWIDEGTSWYVSRFSLKHLWLDRIQAGHLPFYFIFLKFWTMVFGDSEISLRFPSLLASIASLGLFFRITGLMLKRDKAKIFALAIFSFSVYGLAISQEARMYSISLLCFLFTLFLLLKVIDNYPRYSYLYPLSLVIFLLNGSVAIIPYLGIIFFLLTNFKNSLYRRLSFLSLISFAPFIPLYFSVFNRSVNIEVGSYYLRNRFNLNSQLFNLFGWILRFFKDLSGFSELSFQSLSYNLSLLYMLIFSLFAVLAIKGLLGLSKRYRMLVLVIVVTSLVPLFIIFKFESRYFFYLFPFIAIGWGNVLAMISEKRRVLGLTAVALWLTLYTGDTALYFKNPKSAWPDIASYIEEHESKGDEILLLPDFSLGAFSYYYRGDSRVERITPVDKIRIKEDADIWYLVWSNAKLPWVWGDIAIELDNSLKNYFYSKYSLKLSKYFLTKNGEVELHYYKLK